GTVERVRKWARRNPAVAALLAALTVALLAGAVATTFFAVQSAERAKLAEKNADAALHNLELVSAKEKEVSTALGRLTVEEGNVGTGLGSARTEEARAKSAFAAERYTAYLSAIALAANEWVGNNPARVAQLLDSCPPDLRGWEWHHLRWISRAYTRELPEI